ncbi:hypothetical protein PM082_011210 [Marasmius tenuissimus]|nr:hypothetical protein PM082_011210 [Marasmius tenuissimus]
MDLRIVDILAVLILIRVLALYLRKLTSPRPACLPPGPRGLPLLGNVLQLPTSFEWVTYHRWCREFDTDIIHLNAAGASIVVLDSMKAAEELIEKRGTIYSSRPHSVILNELMGHERNFGGYPLNSHDADSPPAIRPSLQSYRIQKIPASRSQSHSRAA